MLNIEKVINNSKLTIGELYDKLQMFPKEQPLMMGYNLYFDSSYPDSFDSYRGVYEECMLEPTTDVTKAQYSTVGGMLNILDMALKDGVMYGYKGGEFVIAEDTLTNVAYYGCTGSPIIDVIMINSIVYVVTDEDYKW